MIAIYVILVGVVVSLVVMTVRINKKSETICDIYDILIDHKIEIGRIEKDIKELKEKLKMEKPNY